MSDIPAHFNIAAKLYEVRPHFLTLRLGVQTWRQKCPCWVKCCPKQTWKVKAYLWIGFL
jgi:hypothetical protein